MHPTGRSGCRSDARRGSSHRGARAAPHRRPTRNAPGPRRRPLGCCWSRRGTPGGCAAIPLPQRGARIPSATSGARRCRCRGATARGSRGRPPAPRRRRPGCTDRPPIRPRRDRRSRTRAARPAPWGVARPIRSGHPHPRRTAWDRRRTSTSAGSGRARPPRPCPTARPGNPRTAVPPRALRSCVPRPPSRTSAAPRDRPGSSPATRRSTRTRGGAGAASRSPPDGGRGRR